MWLDAVEHVLRKISIDVVGKTISTAEAVALVEEHHPDLLVTELGDSNGDLSGLALIERARAAVPSLRPVVLSMHQDAQMIDAALTAGASAYVVKTAHSEDLASAVRQTFSHSVYLAGHRSLTSASVGVAAKPPEEPGLTRRELEILRLVAEGHSNAQLARMLWVTEQTVKFHLSNIYRKLDVANRTEASRWAQRYGLLDGRGPSDGASAPLRAAAG
jgi:DNA-binding NarL/FixJ family response regulator